MSALPLATFVNANRGFWEPGSEPMNVKSIVGVSSINNTVYPPINVLPEFFTTLGVSSLTSVSSINGVVYPPTVVPVSSFNTVKVSSITGVSTINGAVYPPASSPRVIYGKVDLATNGQTITYPTAFTSSVSVVVQGTGNKAGVNGFFTINTNNSLSTFQLFYSGQLIYGPIEVFWIAVGV